MNACSSNHTPGFVCGPAFAAQTVARCTPRVGPVLQIWLMAAQFEVRQLRLDAARKILGMALGLCPKDKIFTSYIALELQLGNFDRCRKLYEKYLEWRPENCRAWCRFAELEKSLGEAARCRAIFELAITQPVLDMPEILWKARLPSPSLKPSLPLCRETPAPSVQKVLRVPVFVMECACIVVAGRPYMPCQ